MASGSTVSEDFSFLDNALSCASPRPPLPRPDLPPARGERVLSPREALFSRQERIPAAKALGRVCGAPTVACPPAIPIAVSGERIGPEAAALFRQYGVETVDVVRN